MAKVTRFPGTPHHKPLLNKEIEIVCPCCGNTEVFLFKIFAFPLALVEKQRDGRYVATDLTYKQDGTIGETPMCCFRCGCVGIQVKEAEEGVEEGQN